MSYFDFSELREPDERLTNSIGAAAIKRAQENFHRKTGYNVNDPIRQLAKKLVAENESAQDIENQYLF